MVNASFIGFNPYWDETFEFVAKVPELAHILFLVKDNKSYGKDDILGAYSLPLTCLQSGMHSSSPSALYIAPKVHRILIHLMVLLVSFWSYGGIYEFCLVKLSLN